MVRDCNTRMDKKGTKCDAIMSIDNKRDNNKNDN